MSSSNPPPPPPVRELDTGYRRIARLTGPVLVIQLSYTVMGVVDTAMVGRLGVVALAGVGLGNLVAWWLLAFFWGLLSGVTTLAAQAEGAERPEGADRALVAGLGIGLATAVLLAGLAPLAPTFIGWAGGSAEVREVASSYMSWRLLGGFGFTLFVVVDNFFRGLGRTRATMWCALAQIVLNCGLNQALIFGRWGAPRMGTEGAALGTVLAQLAIGLVLVGLALRDRPGLRVPEAWRLHADVAREHLRVSGPVAVQTFLEMGGITVFTAVVARLGDAQLAATNAVIQAWSVAFMTAVALATTATTLVGQSIGAGRPDDGRVGLRRVMRVGYAVTLALGVVYVAFPEPLMRVFVEAGESDRLLPFARPLFTVVVLCLIFDLEFNVLSGALRGAGDTTYPMLVNLGSAWLLFVPATLWAAPRFGLVGAWSCLILHVGVMALALRLRVRGRSWLRPALKSVTTG